MVPYRTINIVEYDDTGSMEIPEYDNTGGCAPIFLNGSDLGPDIILTDGKIENEYQDDGNNQVF
jgi:hypothetical protein